MTMNEVSDNPKCRAEGANWGKMARFQKLWPMGWGRPRLASADNRQRN